MKKILYLVMAVAATALTFSSCQGNNEPDPVGTTYPRVQLIEHFTGADCGYCPAGMDYIYESYSADQDNIVWVSNHYGYGTDDYTIASSSKIGKKLSVSGAPSISINRYQYTNSSAGYSKAKSYHPYYTSAVLKKQETTATSCITLSRTWDATTRNLHVKAVIKTADTNLAGVWLTLGITESGPVGPQADYYDTWEGWTEFTHTHVIRVYATDPLGDDYAFKNRVATAEYDIPIDAAWTADNCEIVAWITETGTVLPVLNAAKLPVVEGTKGGENIKHGGITEKAVSADYPESGAPLSNILFTKYSKKLTAGTGYNIAGITLQSDTVVGTYGSYGNLFPYLALYLSTSTADSIPYGTYTVASTMDDSTVVAGYRDDAEHAIDGSLLYYLFSYNSSMYTYSEWMVNAGSVVVSAEGITIDITTKNGSAFKAQYVGNPNASATAMPERIQPAVAPLLYLQQGAPACRLLFF